MNGIQRRDVRVLSEGCSRTERRHRILRVQSPPLITVSGPLGIRRLLPRLRDAGATQQGAVTCCCCIKARPVAEALVKRPIVMAQRARLDGCEVTPLPSSGDDEPETSKSMDDSTVLLSASRREEIPRTAAAAQHQDRWGTGVERQSIFGIAPERSADQQFVRNSQRSATPVQLTQARIAHWWSTPMSRDSPA